MLEQLSCLQEIKEEKTEEPKAAGQPCGEGNLSKGSPASEEPLHLGDTAHLSIDGMGIVLFSPEVMRYVVPGSDFLTEEFTDPKQVGEHIRKGDITAFCTGTGGDFILWLRSGYPDSNVEKEFPAMIRLVVEVRGGSLQFGDLFWLSDWNPDIGETTRSSAFILTGWRKCLSLCGREFLTCLRKNRKQSHRMRALRDRIGESMGK